MKKRFGRIGALAAAAALAVGLGGAPAAMAADPDPITSVPFSKTLYVGENVSTPTDTFEFTVAPASNLTPPTDSSDYSTLLEAGPDGGLAAPDNVTSAEAVAGTGKADQDLAIDMTKFTHPGIFRYEVAETRGELTGMAYDSTHHFVDLYVDYRNGALQVSNVIISTPGGAKEGDASDETGTFSGVEFHNTYATAGDDHIPDDNPDGLLHDVSVEKEVTGNQGDQTKDFPFSATFTNANGVALKYKKVDKDGNVLQDWSPIASGDTFTLKHGDKLILGGLSDGSTYKFTETQDGYYIASVTGNAQVEPALAPLPANSTLSFDPQTVNGADQAVKFVNDRTGTIPTGIFLNYKAYWILGGAALVLAFGLTRRRGLREEL